MRRHKAEIEKRLSCTPLRPRFLVDRLNGSEEEHLRMIVDTICEQIVSSVVRSCRLRAPRVHQAQPSGFVNLKGEKSYFAMFKSTILSVVVLND